MGEPFPFKKFNKKLLKLTRKQSGLVLQIHSGHLPLNHYLHKIKKSQTSNCPSCHVAHNAPPAPETIMHFLFHCPAHNIARDNLIEKIGPQHLNLADIMSKTDNILHLIDYVNKTEHLKTINQANP